MTFVNLKSYIFKISSWRRKTRNLPIVSKLKIPNEGLLKGFEIGIPLNIISNVYTNLHYGYDITSLKLVSLQFLLGYYTYGLDRYSDALDYQQNKYETDKKEYYELIYQNKDLYQASFFITFMCICNLLLSENEYQQMIPFILILIQTNFYKDIKKIIGPLKPVYISIMWTLSSIILPCVIHDHNYSILEYPMDYLPLSLSLFGSSNLADCQDIQEDQLNNIETLPIKYGLQTAIKVSMVSLALSGLLFGLSPNYLDRPVINSIVELQNAGTSLIPFFLLNNTLSDIGITI